MLASYSMPQKTIFRNGIVGCDRLTGGISGLPRVALHDRQSGLDLTRD
jgi:hypothetical protein